MAVSLFILCSKRIKKLVLMKQLPDTLLHTSYQILPDTEQRVVDGVMPYIHWFGVGFGSNCNFNHFQNFCVHLVVFILSKVDKLVMFQSAARHSYLNTVERLMSIENIGLTNHATCLDPDIPLFLLDILCITNSMKQTDGSVVSNDEDGGSDTSVANNYEDGGSEPNDDVEERSGDNDSTTASDKVVIDSQVC
eukprot:7795400-Ditylum_brightwellii.AAC.1